MEFRRVLFRSVPPDWYMSALREICDEHNILLVFDEIITGFGRTGKWFAAEYPGVWPDIFCCGKGVTSGYSPLSLVFMTDRVADDDLPGLAEDRRRVPMPIATGESETTRFAFRDIAKQPAAYI